jgi:hypothetical protein
MILISSSSTPALIIVFKNLVVLEILNSLVTICATPVLSLLKTAVQGLFLASGSHSLQVEDLGEYARSA